jgi:Tol biopolymer transport system component
VYLQTPTATPTPELANETPAVDLSATGEADMASSTPDEVVAVLPTATATLLPTETASPTPTVTLTPQPTLAPTATPVGGGFGQIAFASNRTGLPQIWIMNGDGSEKRQITDTEQGACQPSWSPDGMQIVFISPCDNHREVYTGSSLFIVNADGTGLAPLPTVGGGDYSPAWSPDGKKIVFTSLRNKGTPSIYILNLEDRSVELIMDSERWDLQPSWSADGDQIIYISTQNGPYQIWIMNLDGTSSQRFSSSGGKKNTYPVWSPDEQLIVYTQSETENGIPRLSAARYPDGAASEFRVYPFAGNIPMRKADFSPDGFWLVLESWPDGVNHDIYVMTPNGAERIQLTTDPALDFDPDWRPILP